ncbi:hypothetical protein [Shimia sediminis]|uniref:hypothetical protein n=1 Tax=Shimia sediminis TaxID=2497945 RepID=UPI000F8CCF66|nr:hypothetical protein [Shimia sediminis]
MNRTTSGSGTISAVSPEFFNLSRRAQGAYIALLLKHVADDNLAAHVAASLTSVLGNIGAMELCIDLSKNVHAITGQAEDSSVPKVNK